MHTFRYTLIVAVVKVVVVKVVVAVVVAVVVVVVVVVVAHAGTYLHTHNPPLFAQIVYCEREKKNALNMPTTTRSYKRKRTCLQAADCDTPGTLVVFSDPPVTIDIGRAGTSVELGGRLWEVEVDEEESTLRLSVTTMSDDSKDALSEVLAARSHEAVQREKEAEALGADLERLMERARQV